MILASLLLAIQAAPAEPVPEIVVLGNLRSAQVSVGQDSEGDWHCSLSKSTGRPSLDDRFCRAVTKCVREGTSDEQAVSSCIRETRARLMRRVQRAMERNPS